MSEHRDARTMHAGTRTLGDPAHFMDVATTRQFMGAPRIIAILEDAVDRAVAAGRTRTQAPAPAASARMRGMSPSRIHTTNRSRIAGRNVIE